MKRSQQVRIGVKQLIKNQAASRILAIAPEWKQRNLLARSVELQDVQRQRILTDAEVAENDEIKRVWGQVQAIRTYSDALEAAVDVGETVDLADGWPL